MTSKILLAAVVAFLVLHGAIHLLGTVVYMRFAEIDGFGFKTTVLGGKVDLGESGIRVFGALWLLPALGFSLAAMSLWLGWPWIPSLVASALVSLVLTGADWNIAFMGGIADAAILALIPIARHVGWPIS